MYIKKTVSALLIATLAYSAIPAVTYAANASNVKVQSSAKQSYSDLQLNSFMEKAGVPSDVLAHMDRETKLFIIRNSAKNSKYLSVNVSKYHQNADKSLTAIATSSTGQVSPLTISTTDVFIITPHTKAVYS